MILKPSFIIPIFDTSSMCRVCLRHSKVRSSMRSCNVHSLDKTTPCILRRCKSSKSDCFSKSSESSYRDAELGTVGGEEKTGCGWANVGDEAKLNTSLDGFDERGCCDAHTHLRLPSCRPMSPFSYFSWSLWHSYCRFRCSPRHCRCQNRTTLLSNPEAPVVSASTTGSDLSSLYYSESHIPSLLCRNPLLGRRVHDLLPSKFYHRASDRTSIGGVPLYNSWKATFFS